MVRVFFFLFGFGFMVIGLSFIILYLNLMTMGYNFGNYVNFIIREPECRYLLLLPFQRLYPLPAIDRVHLFLQV